MEKEKIVEISVRKFDTTKLFVGFLFFVSGIATAMLIFLLPDLTGAVEAIGVLAFILALAEVISGAVFLVDFLDEKKIYKIKGEVVEDDC